MRLFCWIFGHKWFPTVMAEATYQSASDWGWGRQHRGLFLEKLCTRCGHQKAFHQKTLLAYDPEDHAFDQAYGPNHGHPTADEKLAKMAETPTFTQLPGDWT